MIDNFETVKKQLSELAGVINSFKTEAVQLKIIEIIFGESGISKQTASGDKQRNRRGKGQRKTPRKKEPTETAAGKKKKGAGGTGAVATLVQLAEGEFFNQPRTINDIIEHCKHNLARTFKANEFSGKLGRMVRHEELVREKNKDNQYEYKKT